MHGVEGIWQSKDGGNGFHGQRGKRGRELEGKEVADIVEDALAFRNGVAYGHEVVVGEHHISRLLGDVRALLAHCNSNIGSLKRSSIIHAVARHGNDFFLALEGTHQSKLMSGGNSIEDFDTDNSFGKGLRGDRIQFFPTQGASYTAFEVINRIMRQWLALGNAGAAATRTGVSSTRVKRGVDWTHNSTSLGDGYCGFFAIASHHKNIDSTTA